MTYRKLHLESQLLTIFMTDSYFPSIFSTHCEQKLYSFVAITLEPFPYLTPHNGQRLRDIANRVDTDTRMCNTRVTETFWEALTMKLIPN